MEGKQMPVYMRIKEYCEYSGIPAASVIKMINSDWKMNNIARKIDPAKKNSPWLVHAEKMTRAFASEGKI